MIRRIDRNVLNSCSTFMGSDGRYCILCAPVDDAGDYWLNHSGRREFQKGLQLLLDALQDVGGFQYQQEIEILFGCNTRFKGKRIVWNIGQTVATWPPMLFDFPASKEN